MVAVRRVALKKAWIWLFAAAWLTAFFGTAPRERWHAAALRADAASIAPVPPRDAGKALVRDVHSLRIATPAPEPLPPLIPPRAAFGVEAPAGWVNEAARVGTRGITARIVRWRHHVPRMDSGEPPRSDAFAS